MLTLPARSQLLIALGLAILMAATRGHHFATLQHLPSASWAVFFVAGLYLRPRWVLTALLAETWLLDFAAFTWGNSSGFCLTPAYVFLLPAYSTLWFAARLYAKHYHFAWRTLLPLGLSILLGAFVCELFSSGGFYFFSGRFAEPTFAEFATRLVRYFPSQLQSLGFYVGIATVVHVAFVLLRGTSGHKDAMAG